MKKERMQQPRPETIGDFLYRLPEFQDRLATYQPSDNGEIKQKLDELLADDCALAQDFHSRRK